MHDDESRDLFEIAGAEVISKDFGDEAVVANLNTGMFYSLNDSASAIWLHLEAGGSIRDIVSTSAQGESAAIRSFVRALVAEQLLVPSAAPRRMSEIKTVVLDCSPSFERFEDLQGLLLVDPIHEASGAGWPLRA